MRFASNQNGNISVIFALALVPLVAMTGSAVEYARAQRQKSVLTAAADAGILAGVSAGRDSLKKGQTDWKKKAEAVAMGVFKANSGAMPEQGHIQAHATFTVVGTKISGKMEFSSTIPSNFMKVVGIEKISVAGTSAASMTATRYNDMHIIVDTSSSMGIGATVADQNKLMAAIGCQVACHFSHDGGLTDPLTTARSKTNAVLRIDVVKNALSAAISKIPNDGLTRVAIYTLNNTVEPYFPLSTDIAAAANAMKSIDLVNELRQGGTNISYGLKTFAAQLSIAGNGLSAASPTGTVILATDGVEDSNIVYQLTPSVIGGNDPNFMLQAISKYSSNYYQTLDPAQCNGIKSKGYNMYTLEVQYIIPSPVSSTYTERLDFIKNQLLVVPQAMAQCASMPTQFFHAETSSDIAAAVQALFISTQPLALNR